MRFLATDDQVKQIAANAVNASIPVGMGFLHFVAGEHFKPEDFKILSQGWVESNGEPRGISLDYVQGRMVKLSMREVSPGLWQTNDTISADYESWICKYPTVAALLASAGVTETELETK
jgi:hypothetical protein